MELKKINENIFREYDVRGIYGSDLDIDVAYTFGRSFATYISKMGNTEVIVGHDNRESSPELSEGLIKGLMESGASVTDLGLVTTPMYYFAKLKNKIETGIMITASHNPREYNGFKISFSIDGNACGKAITDFRDFTNKLEFISKEGTYRSIDIKNEYLNEVKNSVDIGNRKVKVVYDCGNGTGSIIVKEMLDMFNIEYDLLYCDSDPTFPNHHPDPCVEANLEALKKKVIETHSDIGVGFDGDGDRVGVISNTGKFIPMDHYLILMIKDMFNRVEPKKFLYDVKCSKAVQDVIDELGGEGECYRTGNSYTRARVYELHLPVGAELSGHVYFNDHFLGFDSGLYAGLRIIELLSRCNKTVDELVSDIPKYYSTDEIKIHADDSIKFEIVSKIEEYVKEKEYKYLTIDGIKVLFDDGFALLRASNTGPNLTLRFEAKTEDRLEEISKEFTELVEKLLNK